MNYIAVCVMTHEHPDTVEQVLENCAAAYRACELDMYYYDSSSDDRTAEIIAAYNEAGYDNIHHLCFRGLSGDQKLAQLYLGTGLEKDYEYIWVVKDRSVCDAVALLLIYKEIMFEKPDLLVIDTYSDKRLGRSVSYTDPAELYRDYAWEITSMDVTVFGRRMLEGFVPNEEPWPLSDPRSSFMQYDLVFRRLSELEAPKIRVISNDDVRILNSTKSGSMWVRQIFDVWVRLWTRENEGLPGIYEPYKETVMKSSAVPDLLKSVEGLNELRNKGILTEAVIDDELLERWEKVSDIPASVLVECAGKV